MKTPKLLIHSLVLLLASCSASVENIETPPTVITVEVTRIIEITATPVPTDIVTPSPTIGISDAMATVIAEEIGTPIVASSICYDTALTQLEMNSCAIGRRQELEKQLADLLKALEKTYRYFPPEELASFHSFQAEWEDLAKRECEFRSGMIVVEENGGLYYKGGRMAVAGYNDCMVEKYQWRLRELQIMLFNATHQ